MLFIVLLYKEIQFLLSHIKWQPFIIYNLIVDKSFLNESKQPFNFAFALRLIWLMGDMDDSQLSASSGNLAFVLFDTVQ